MLTGCQRRREKLQPPAGPGGWSNSDRRLLYGGRLRMWSSDGRTGNLHQELTKTHTKTTFCPTYTHTVTTHATHFRAHTHLNHIKYTNAHTHQSPTCTLSHFYTLVFHSDSGWRAQWRGRSGSNATTPTALIYMNVVVSHSFLNRLLDGAIKHAFCCHDVWDSFTSRELCL